MAASKLRKKSYEPTAKGTLAGVRVLDLSRLVAGNTLTQVLGDFGAEVIKVEPPAGDTLRAWQTNGVQTNWKLYARNKKSLGLELRKPEARDILARLIPTAAMFVESFRPGTLEKMGLAPERLFEHNPKLIIVRISGWGQEGPYRRRPGFGTLVEGMSGFASFNGFADREPVLPPMYLADTIAGLYGAAAAMIALREVEKKGGRGQVIDLPLLDPIFAVLGPQAANYRLTGKVKPRTGSRSTNAGPRNAYRCKDGLYVCLSSSTQKMAERLFHSIGRSDLVDDPRYRTNAERARNRDTLIPALQEAFLTRTYEEWETLLLASGIPMGAINTIPQIVDHPQVKARGALVEMDHPRAGKVRMVGAPVRLSETPGSVRTPAPRLGEHTDAVLGDLLGLDAGEIDTLRAAGVIGPKR